MNGTATTTIPWHDEPNHFTLLEDDNVIVYGMISTKSSDWFSLCNDTVIVILSGAILGIQGERNSCGEVQVQAGDVRFCEASDSSVVQRVVASSSVMASLNIENRGGSLFSQPFQRSLLTGNSVRTVQSNESFYSVSHVTIPSHGGLTLNRSDGVSPYCTVIISEDTNVDLSGLVQVTNYGTVTSSTELRYGVSVSTITVFNSDVQGGKDSIIVSNASSDLNLYIVDVWIVPKEVPKLPNSPTTPVTWRDEPLHFPLVEAPGVTIYCSVSTGSCDWHSHSHDTIYVVLSNASATNELAGEPPRPIVLHKGTSFSTLSHPMFTLAFLTYEHRLQS